MKLTNDQMICNLRLLIDNCELFLKSSVTMKDLKNVIENDVSTGDETQPISKVIAAADSITRESATESIRPVFWPPKIQDHILVNFDDGFRVGEVVEVIGSDRVKVELMRPKRVRTAMTVKLR